MGAECLFTIQTVHQLGLRQLGLRMLHYNHGLVVLYQLFRFMFLHRRRQLQRLQWWAPMVRFHVLFVHIILVVAQCVALFGIFLVHIWAHRLTAVAALCFRRWSVECVRIKRAGLFEPCTLDLVRVALALPRRDRLLMGTSFQVVKSGISRRPTQAQLACLRFLEVQTLRDLSL